MNEDDSGTTNSSSGAGNAGETAPAGTAATATTAGPGAQIPIFDAPRAQALPNLSWPLAKIPLRETIALILGVVLWDLVIYIGLRDQVFGYAGCAVFLVGTGVLLWFGTGQRRPHRATAIVLAAIMILGIRLLWQGNGMAVLLGLMLIIGLTMTLAGLPAFIFEGIGFALQIPVAGVVNLINHLRSFRLGTMRIERHIWIPICVVAGFVLFFVLANPDIHTFLKVYLEKLAELIRSFSPSAARVVFWMIATLAVAGLLRPRLIQGLMEKIGQLEIRSKEVLPAGVHAFATARNTLLSVVVLFAAYLAFEIAHLVVREIPEGFYYSGYAHRGAMWLTVALAFSTFTLGALLRAPVMAAPGAGLLRRLTLIWTVENLILAACVMHRLQIYVNYNGMSKMRVVGYCGVAAVAIGFVLAVIKSLDRRTLIWLVRRDLWALFGVCFVFAVAPVDRWVAAYNTRMILAGNPSPAVQITTHPISAEALPALLPLAQCEDPIIRDGIRAVIVNDLMAMILEENDWREYQMAEDYARARLTGEAVWPDSAVTGDDAIERFRQYTRQWYD